MAFDTIALLALLIIGGLLFLTLFEPGLEYKVNVDLPAPDSIDFFRLLSAVVDEPALEMLHVDVLKNGDRFYPAELDAIMHATTSIHLEAFIFHATPIGERFLNALTERARAGVTVRITVDAFGSMLTRDRFFAPLRAAGGHVVWYQPLRWYTLKRYNNRTHRELLVVDGNLAFIGGAGIASAWDTGVHAGAPWRDTMVRVTGPVVAALQTVFIENWLEGSGEILADKTVFPTDNRFEMPTVVGERLSLVVASSPTAGRGARARILFQLLIASARTELFINSPYFLPDRAMRRELLSAVARGVKVTVITPGKSNNHLLARCASRRFYGELIAGGVMLHEYQPGMIHAKILIVDQCWSVVGSTNFDCRSFELNDEVNLAVLDQGIATRLAVDFAIDLKHATQITLQDWKNRSIGERLLAIVGRLLERQE